MTRYRFFYPILALLKHFPLAVVLLLFITCNGNAHPHLFMQTRFTLVFDDQGLSGIRVYWTLDEMYSSMTGNDFDKDGDGVFNAQESGELIKLALESLPEFDFFTHITVDGQPIPVKQVTQFDITFESGILDYQFYIPCKVNAIGKKRNVNIAPYDPGNYAVMLFSDDQPVLIENGDTFSIQSTIEEDKEKKIYFDMIHPITLKLVLQKKP